MKIVKINIFQHISLYRMPIQAPHWTDYLNCPVCCREFGPSPHSPISLGCGHTFCEQCLTNLNRKHCPFDQTQIQGEPEELAINTALLQLAGYTPPPQPVHPRSIQALSETDQQSYDVIIRSLEHLAIDLKLCGNNSIGNRLSRPMQRKLVTLLQCAISDEDGRGRAARAARSLGERSVTEIILQHQNPQQLSANLWAAVRARGCQFLGPAMQEEVLKLILLALEDGSPLSRKVLVMFVVQRLEGDFPQASKTSIGHVVQLLYRASCFKVSKRVCDSSLMQLKEEFRTYESLRREHDAQIVQIATEAGLRIAPDQWSALLYGDTAHKSHMQSIIDKLQTPLSFAQSIQELCIALQRSGDPCNLVVMTLPLDRLASVDPNPDAESPTWQQLAEIIIAVKDVVSGLVIYLQQQSNGRESNCNQKPITTKETSENATTTRSSCPIGSRCLFVHFDDDIERYRQAQMTAQTFNSTNLHCMSVPPPTLGYMHVYKSYPPPQSSVVLRPPMQAYPLNPHHMPGTLPTMQVSPTQQEMAANSAVKNSQEGWHHPMNYASAVRRNQTQVVAGHNNLPISSAEKYAQYSEVTGAVMNEDASSIIYQRPEYFNTMYQTPKSGMYDPHYQGNMHPTQLSVYVPMYPESNTYGNNIGRPANLTIASGLGEVMHFPTASDVQGPSDTAYKFKAMMEALPKLTSQTPSPTANNAATVDRRAVGADRLRPVGIKGFNAMYNSAEATEKQKDEHELDLELEAIQQRIHTEF
ncbi:roquin-1 isoform X3 [Leptidea sinapis]|uniref:roquin-1 isoform X3 n=1 Tax=Leptidea sinapis TaxID=189913 RepID=UPI0021C4782F|nr:roquin-1 isoform X3 [Leptidea sinapis]